MSSFQSIDLVNLYFTYRWLLLECKREFPFNDALRVLEVMWATLPIDPDPPVLSELVLITSPSDTMISDILHQPVESRTCFTRAQSCPQLSLLPESKSAPKPRHRSSSLTSPNPEQLFTLLEQQQIKYRRQSTFDHGQSSTHSTSDRLRSRAQTVDNSFSLSEISDFDFEGLGGATAAATTTTAQKASSHHPSYVLLNPNWVQELPTGDTSWLNEENSFLLFLCISILLYHRNFLLKQPNMDEQEISMHFDRFRRRHNAERILHCARILYGQFIQWLRKKRTIEDFARFSAS